MVTATKTLLAICITLALALGLELVVLVIVDLQLSQHLKLKQTHVRMMARVANYPVCQKQFQNKIGSNNYSLGSLCSVNHSSICWSSSGNFGVQRPMVVHFADIFSSPLNSLAIEYLVHTCKRSPSCFRQLQLRQQL